MSRCVGIPTESKPLEGRVGLIPGAVAELTRAGHRVLVQRGAGLQSGYVDDDYAEAGAELVDGERDVYARAEVIIKVKEPIGDEIGLLRREHTLFCFLHLAANRALMDRLVDIGLTAVAFETVADQTGLPLLMPMSMIAGRIAVQVGTHLLHTPNGGRGVLLGGVPGTGRGSVVILGAGHAGGAAARLAAGIGADVTVFDRNPVRLAEMQDHAPNINALFASQSQIDEAVERADLVIGAILLPGAAAARIVSRETVARMTPGSVIVDISVDQGGCIATTRPTTYDDPTYVAEGVVHFSVTNMPGAVPRSASQALSAVVTPYALRLLDDDWQGCEPLRVGINVRNGEVVYPALRG